MSWQPITASEVLEEFTPAEQTSINAIQGANTNLDGILVRTVNQWRGAISRNQSVGDEGTVPDDCRPEIIAQARWNWLRSLPLLKALQTDPRKDAATEAKELLLAIRKGQLVEAVDVDDSESTAPRFPSTERVRTYDRETDQDGI